MMRVGFLTTVLLLAAGLAHGEDIREEISELPSSLQGHYAVWASIEKDGDISTKLEKKDLPLFFVGPRHAVTIGVGTIFERIEKHQVGSRTFYTCHPHPATGENASDIMIENLGGGVLLFSEKGEHLLCKRTERTLVPGLTVKRPSTGPATKQTVLKPPPQSAEGKSVSKGK